MEPSSIRQGRFEDLPELRRLHTSCSRSYYYDDLGDTEEPELLAGVNAVLEDQQSERLRGYISFDGIRRSAVLPVSAPTKVSLRAAAFTSAGAAARLQFRVLFEHAQEQLPPQSQGYLFSALTEQGWLSASLKEAGFDFCDSVQLYERRSPEVEIVRQPAVLRPVQPSDLLQLAELDAATFEPLWHMGTIELKSLLRNCRFEIAEFANVTAGYSALRLNSDGSPRGFNSAQIVRLAVHPRFQGKGIGRQLLVSSLRYTHELGADRVFLNTQASNAPSRKLYESLQFRRRGRPIPVFIKRANRRLAQVFTL
ncbi:MAG: GNAT family N-acetyltransferase [Caldilineaceae bacterium]|nr:GNAT family N-acetyltransferase [Caldilineaceae bacterium]